MQEACCEHQIDDNEETLHTVGQRAKSEAQGPSWWETARGS